MTITQSELAHFTGTENWYKYNPLFPRLLLTDGTKYLADKAGAYWLMDIIGSVQHKLRGEEFQVWTLQRSKKGSGATVTCEDGNGKKLYSKSISFTDFPFASIELYCEQGDGHRVVMLPSER